MLEHIQRTAKFDHASTPLAVNNSNLPPQAAGRSGSATPQLACGSKTLRCYARMFSCSVKRAFRVRNVVWVQASPDLELRGQTSSPPSTPEHLERFHNVRPPTYLYLDGTHQYCVIAVIVALAAPLCRSGMSLHIAQQHHQALATGALKLEAFPWKLLHEFIRCCSPRPPIRLMSARGTRWCFPAASLMQTPLPMYLAIVIRSSHAGSLRA